MTNEPLDSRQDKMIAALYGELSPEEEKAFFTLLESDTELKREWNELNETRQFMAAARSEESGFEFDGACETPGFEFDPTAINNINKDTNTGRNKRSGWIAWLDLLRTPAAGFATVAAVMVILLLCGLRVDTVNGGMLVHFGSTPQQQPLLAGSDNLVPGSMPFSAADYVTHEELMNYTQNIMNISEARLLNIQGKQQENLVRTVVGFYDEFSREYTQNRQQTQAELAKIWFGLEGLERFGTQRQNTPVRLDDPPEFTPVGQPVNLEMEEK